MLNKDYRYLKLVKYKNIENWSVQYFTNNQLDFGEKYELKKIGSFLTRNKTPITVEDHIYYKRVTIKINNGGCYLRDEIEGKHIGTKQQFLISEGQFILSKIDARNGAMGVVPHECDKAIITGNFWTFDVNKNLVNSNYLSLATTTNAFIKFAEKASNGTTNRHYLQESLFLSVKIPLPSLSEQQALVKAYNDKIQQAETLEKQAEQIGKDIDAYLNDELGISQSESSDEQNIVNEYKFLRFVNFKYLREWGFNKIINHKKNLSCINNDANGYKTTQLSDIISLKSGFFLPKDKQNGTLYDVYGGNGITGTHNEYCFSGKRVVIGRVGEYCGNIHLVDGNYWVTDNALIVDQKSDNITWEYLAIALKLLNLNQYKNISAQPVISQKKILVLSIPLPSIDIQNVIVKHINKQKEQIKQLKQQAANLRKKALEEFEKEIFE